ncbi:hypothetical protein CTI12_AA518520 [Artemisia annua]|uniref:Uncharacterized protein n=1 Tax=Artemisia annua TaxID=35608 RepID=A0A2U1L612_ARTAN|nr:hypothetical protein CTI12_AA518520 [Artemisia annua]
MNKPKIKSETQEINQPKPRTTHAQSNQTEQVSPCGYVLTSRSRQEVKESHLWREGHMEWSLIQTWHLQMVKRSSMMRDKEVGVLLRVNIMYSVDMK